MCLALAAVLPHGPEEIEGMHIFSTYYFLFDVGTHIYWDGERSANNREEEVTERRRQSRTWVYMYERNTAIHFHPPHRHNDHETPT